ncbi:hypothetical protein G5C51_07460 [Streptomyces sp. A7024]|uniref:Uncharacterized protein n=1 Tax=Streptomyces coryli TaxID=1128680 RepID=A0A6G4TUT6_9ACTN|nr:hypothetical protein [Streptomyces coryli]NGN63745.1 hypothetical protein [Streptomyces coryli]
MSASSVPQSPSHRRSRRPLLIPAGAAAALLTGLFFIPSATAGPDSGPARSAAAAQQKAGDGVREAARHPYSAGPRAGLDTGSYLAGGATCLVVGSGMAVYVLRRNRAGTAPDSGLRPAGQ